jgi:hypothetical protein
MRRNPRVRALSVVDMKQPHLHMPRPSDLGPDPEPAGPRFNAIVEAVDLTVLPAAVSLPAPVRHLEVAA